MKKKAQDEFGIHGTDFKIDVSLFPSFTLIV